MQNKILCLFSILMIFSSVTLADEIGLNSDSSWGEISGAENAWDGQKMVTEKEYKQIVDELEKRKNAKQIRAQKKAGDPLMKSGAGEMDFLSKFQEQYPLLNLTVPVLTQNGIIPVGHYKVIGIKKGNKVFINLCQSYDVIGSIPAFETEDDFGENDINFVKLEEVDNGILRLIYGSMKFNAYAFVNYENQ